MLNHIAFSYQIVITGECFCHDLVWFFLCRDESLSGSELTSKLEPAFLAGLRCNQPHIRQKFVEVFDNSIKKRLFDRLLYITCSQNWEAMGGHFWIKQCIEVRLCDSKSFPNVCIVPCGLQPVGISLLPLPSDVVSSPGSLMITD